MPRPKTKGDPIQFRLPLHLDTQLETKAKAQGLTRAQYIETLATNFLQRTQDQP